MLFHYSSRNTPSLLLLRYSSTIPTYSLFLSPFLLFALTSTYALHSIRLTLLAVSNTEGEVSGGFLPASS